MCMTLFKVATPWHLPCWRDSLRPLGCLVVILSVTRPPRLNSPSSSHGSGVLHRFLAASISALWLTPVTIYMALVEVVWLTALSTASHALPAVPFCMHLHLLEHVWLFLFPWASFGHYHQSAGSSSSRQKCSPLTGIHVNRKCGQHHVYCDKNSLGNLKSFAPSTGLTFLLQTRCTAYFVHSNLFVFM